MKKRKSAGRSDTKTPGKRSNQSDSRNSTGRRWLEYRRIDELREWVGNPKSHDVPGIKASILEFGYVDPAVWDEKTKRMVAGHGRVEALFEFMTAGDPAPEGVAVDADGMWMIPVLRGKSFKSTALAEGYLIAVNKLPELGGWKRDALKEMLGRIAKAGPRVLTATGFKPANIAALEDVPKPRQSITVKITCPKCRHEFTR